MSSEPNIPNNIIVPCSSTSNSTLLFTNINDEHNEFKKRQSNLFNILLQTEKDTIQKDSYLSVQNKNMTEKIKFHKNLRKQFFNHNSNRNEKCAPVQDDKIVFKKPHEMCKYSNRNSRHAKSNSKPDYQMNPHKWTKYSLNNVTDMSDRSNTKAALTFLNELKKQRSTVDNDTHAPMDVDNENTDKIVFKKKTCMNDGTQNECDSNERNSAQDRSFIGTKCVMPEYSFGGSKKVERKKHLSEMKKDEKNGKQVALKHLFEEDEE